MKSVVDQSKWPKVAVLGAGAVGSYFGGMLVRAGVPVTLIGRNPHVEVINGSGLVLDSIHFHETIRVSATTDISALNDSAIVLICVKSYDTEEAARSIAGHLSSKAIVVSLQNGVDNVERIRSTSGIEALAAAVYVAVELSAPGHVKHTGAGNLAIGDLWDPQHADTSRSDDLKKVTAVFSRAEVPCRLSEDIRSDLWIKLVMNCAYNAISALCHARYGPLSQNQWVQAVMRQVISEIVAVARADGVAIPSADALMESALKLGMTMRDAFSSTAQDVQRGKRTEIDSLNGYVVRRGRELGIVTPANQTLHALMKLLEEVSLQSH
ncbi:MAG TPA: 2-dehydropantoate 2-reductase [Candidatus Angelobacter sp.]